MTAPWHLEAIRAERDRVEQQLDGDRFLQLRGVIRLKLAKLNAYIAAMIEEAKHDDAQA